MVFVIFGGGWGVQLTRVRSLLVEHVIYNLLNIFCRGFLGRLVAAIRSKMHRKVSPLDLRPYLELRSVFSSFLRQGWVNHTPPPWDTEILKSQNHIPEPIYKLHVLMLRHENAFPQPIYSCRYIFINSHMALTTATPHPCVSTVRPLPRSFGSACA